MITRSLVPSSLSLLLVAACGGPKPPDTLGDVCSDVGIAFCDRFAECDGDVNADACATDFFKACCGDDDTCGLTLDDPPSRGEYKDCLDAMADEDCGSVEDGVTPSECLTL